MKRVLCVSVFLFLAACAATTSYGVDPKPSPGEPDVYTFTMFFNAFASASNAEAKVVQQIQQKFMPEHGYRSYEILERHCSEVQGKCTFDIKFSR